MLARRIFVAVMMSIALAWLLVSNDYVGEVVGEYLVRGKLDLVVDCDATQSSDAMSSPR